MFKLQTFKHNDKWYVGVFNSNGDFIKNVGGFYSLEDVNQNVGLDLSTPSGEVVEVESEPTLEAINLGAEEHNTVESEVGIGTPNIPTEEVVNESPVEEKVEISEDGKTATFEDGSTTPVITREELVEKLGEDEVKKLEESSAINEEVKVNPELVTGDTENN